MPAADLTLETFVTPAAYVLRLTNRGAVVLRDLRLCLSGPARLNPEDAIEGARLTRHLSGFAELSALPGTTLPPGGVWEVTVRAPAAPFRHWTDGATSAYVLTPQGRVLPVAVTPTARPDYPTGPQRGTVRLAAPEKAPVTVSILPWPAEVAITGARAAPQGFDIRPCGPLSASAAEAFAGLTEALFPVEALARSAAENGRPVTCRDDAALPPEGYRIDLTADPITLSAGSRSGFLYGLITLGQMLRGARAHPQTFVFPESGQITDQPRMGWRGCHLDAARQFYTSAEIARLLQIMAWNRLNRFHWHLSDDEAWRVEIDAFPALTDIGAWRGHGLPIPPLLGSGPERTGGFYSKDDIRHLVSLAGSLGIEVIPEIDMPGHCHAILLAIPALRDPREGGTYASVQGFPNNGLNPALPATYPVVQTILDELIDLFPSKFLHVGADEVPLAAWSGSPLALARLAEIGGPALASAHAALRDTTGHHGEADAIEESATALLQAEFLGRIQRHLASRGCVTGGWQEAAHGDVIDRDESYLVGWRDVAASGRLAEGGHAIVVSPGQAYYLDMALSPDWDEPGASWAGSSSVQHTYDFDPVAGWTRAQLARFMGVQACIWSEPMTDRAVFDRLVFPRLSAIAETAWTPAAAKSWDRFAALSGLMPNLYGNRQT